jgi:hypothetical protein
MAIGSAVLTPGKAFAVELKTLGILARATLPLPGLAHCRLVLGPLGAVGPVKVQVAEGDRLAVQVIRYLLSRIVVLITISPSLLP